MLKEGVAKLKHAIKRTDNRRTKSFAWCFPNVKVSDTSWSLKKISVVCKDGKGIYNFKAFFNPIDFSLESFNWLWFWPSWHRKVSAFPPQICLFKAHFWSVIYFRYFGGVSDVVSNLVSLHNTELNILSDFQLPSSQGKLFKELSDNGISFFNYQVTQ